jgi:hypothetical protein
VGGGGRGGNPRDRVHAWGSDKFKDLSQGWIERAGNPFRHNRATADAWLRLTVIELVCNNEYFDSEISHKYLRYKEYKYVHLLFKVLESVYYVKKNIRKYSEERKALVANVLLAGKICRAPAVIKHH